MGFKDRLILLSDNKRVTPYKIWKETGISQQTIARYLRNDIVPSGKYLIKLAKYFNVSSEWLLTGLGDIQPGMNEAFKKAFYETDPDIEITDKLDASMRFVSALDALKGKDKLGYSTVAKEIGVSPALFTEIRKGRSLVTLNTLQKLSDRYHISLPWLTKGEGQMFTEYKTAGTELPVVLENKIVYGKASEEKTALEVPFVPLHLRPAFSDANKKYTETIRIIQQNGICYNSGCVIEIDGDSMEPTLINGEQVFCEHIDPSNWKYITGPVAVNFGNNMMVVKRIKENNLNNGELTLWSDNEMGGKLTLSREGDQIRQIFKVKYTVYKPIR